MSDWTNSDTRTPRGSVEDLGRGTYLFRWPEGFYLSPFLVTDDGVVAVDPIDVKAARAYRQAISSVTESPIRAIIYSHDHRDHIVGAGEMSLDAEVLAHPNTHRRILEREDRDIRIPTRLIDQGDILEFGRHRIEVHYHGPNHSTSNLALVLPAGGKRMLLYVDVVEPGVAPYRELPDTDFAGLLHSLDRASELGVDLVAGGHAGPDDAIWIDHYRIYFADLVEATRAEFSDLGGQTPLPGEDGVAMTERVRRATCDSAAGRLRPRYGSWRGFDQWAPMNADRVLSYLITGN